MQVEANPPSTLHDIMWRNRVRLERKAAAQPPPRPDPRSLVMTELLGLNPDAVQALRQPPSVAGLRMNMSSVEGGLFHAMQQPHDRPRGGGAFAPAIKRDQSIHYPRRQSDRRPVMSRVASAPALRPSTAPPPTESDPRPLPQRQQQQALPAQHLPPTFAAVSLHSQRSLPLPLRELVSRAAVTDSPALRATVREIELRVALERVKRDEQRARAELARWQTRKEQRQRFEERSGTQMSEYRFEIGETAKRSMRSNVDRIVFGRDIDGSEKVEVIADDWGMFGPRRRRDQRQIVSEVDMIVFGRDQDNSNQTHYGASYGGGESAFRRRVVDNRQFRSEVDEAVFGHDQDFSRGLESYSRRHVHVPG